MKTKLRRFIKNIFDLCQNHKKKDVFDLSQNKRKGRSVNLN